MNSMCIHQFVLRKFIFCSSEGFFGTYIGFAHSDSVQVYPSLELMGLLAIADRRGSDIAGQRSHEPGR